MPITWELQGPVLVVTVVGEYDFHGFPRLLGEVKNDPQYRAGLSVLYDVRRIEADITKDVVESWGNRVAWLVGQGFSKWCAIVVGEKRYQYGMARMAAAHLEEMGVDLLVTRDFDAALAHLAPGSGGEGPRS